MDVNLDDGLMAYIEENDVIFNHPVEQLSHRQVKKICEGMTEYNRSHHGTK